VAIQALLQGGLDAGRVALSPIAYPPRVIAPRPTLKRTLMCGIFYRDHFCCRYCGGRTILTPVMEVLGELYPEIFPFHPNWKGGVTHPAVIARSTIVDHLVPGAMGGSWLDPDNLVTACWPCNAIKADYELDQLGWELQPITADSWDGLTCYYRALWEQAGQPKPTFHEAWLEALEVSRPHA
jgi:HNH endonuclease